MQYIGVNANRLIPILMLSALFLMSYGGFLFLFKLSPEDHVILDNLRKRLLKHKGQQIEHAA